jgi:hypothetical protein
MRTAPERAANAKLWWQACRLHGSRLSPPTRLPLQDRTRAGKEHA